jgi:hypothetical protein
MFLGKLRLRSSVHVIARRPESMTKHHEMDLAHEAQKQVIYALRSIGEPDLPVPSASKPYPCGLLTLFPCEKLCQRVIPLFRRHGYLCRLRRLHGLGEP